ncbi:MAG: hypothetical protein ACE1Z8_03155 [Candidatus Acidiferrales bacterium]
MTGPPWNRVAPKPFPFWRKRVAAADFINGLHVKSGEKLETT